MKYQTRIVGSLNRIQKRRPVLLLTLFSLALCSSIFPPIGWWPLAYICLVPWMVGVCASGRPRFLYLVSYLLGVGFFLINVRWMRLTTPPGYIAMSLWFAIFFPLAAWPIRHLYRRRGMSVALSAPIAWVAMEYLRSIGPLGFPWLLLGHSQYQCLSVIQISDLVGAYGVSFMIVMVNGWLTDLLIQPIVIERAGDSTPKLGSSRITRLPFGSLATLLVVAGTLIYGSTQRTERSLQKGPRIAVVQHDIPMYVNPRPGQQLYADSVVAMHLALAKKAAADKPDLIVLPETIIQCFLNESFLNADRAALDEINRRRYGGGDVRNLESYQAFSRHVRDAFQRLSNQTHIPIVLGASAVQWRPTGIPPRVDAYNSAFLLKPGHSKPAARYDKRHLVMFGEYVPFRYQFPSLHNWLNAQTPWGRDGHDYSLTPGDQNVVFEFQSASAQNRSYRAGAPICYEEIMPSIARDFTRGESPGMDKKNIDLLLSISNDGWFLHSAELEQHLAAAVFRAVENRISVARSVNTGTSAMVYPSGRIHKRVMLTKRQIAKLDRVTGSLDQLHRIAVALQTKVDRLDACRLSKDRLVAELSTHLRRSLAEMGEEFLFLHDRLRRLSGNLLAKQLDFRRSAAAILLQQIEDDRSMVLRWQKKPWTAPGFVVDTALLDRRITLYTRWGDWFAIGALGLTGLVLIDWYHVRITRRHKTRRTREGLSL